MPGDVSLLMKIMGEGNPIFIQYTLIFCSCTGIRGVLLRVFAVEHINQYNIWNDGFHNISESTMPHEAGGYYKYVNCRGISGHFYCFSM